MTRSWIEAVPKRVEIVRLSDGRFATKPGTDLARFLDNVLDIRARIESGRERPESCCRKSIGKDHRRESRGWLHLHVGYGRDDDVLPIVEQTEDTVAFIGLTDHEILRGRPHGRSSAGLGSRIARAKLERSVPPTPPVRKS